MTYIKKNPYPNTLDKDKRKNWLDDGMNDPIEVIKHTISPTIRYGVNGKIYKEKQYSIYKGSSRINAAVIKGYDAIEGVIVEDKLPKYFFYENFLTNDECDTLINLYKKNESNAEFWHINKTYYVEANSIEEKWHIKSVVDKIESTYKQLKGCELDTCQLVKWPINSYHVAHLDKTKDRFDKWSFFIYLNEDFEGGETELINIKTIVPQRGALLMFEPGIMEHKVNKVLKKERYTLAGWYV